MRSGLNVEDLLFGTSRRLAHIRRYASIPVNRVENVAEHSFYVSFYALMLAKDLVKQKQVEIDWERLYTATIVHDVDESLTGDVLRHVKRKSHELHEMWNRMCEKVVSEFCEELGIDFLDDWKNDKDMNSLEGFILSLADFLCVFSYGYEEYMTGNQNMKKVMAGSYKWVRDIFEEHSDSDHPAAYLVKEVLGTLQKKLNSLAIYQE